MSSGAGGAPGGAGAAGRDGPDEGGPRGTDTWGGAAEVVSGGATLAASDAVNEGTGSTSPELAGGREPGGGIDAESAEAGCTSRAGPGDVSRAPDHRTSPTAATVNKTPAATAQGHQRTRAAGGMLFIRGREAGAGSP